MRQLVIGLLLVMTLFATAAASHIPDNPMPCEWFPVDPEDVNGAWFQPNPSEECEPPFENKPRMTLPPTDTGA